MYNSTDYLILVFFSVSIIRLLASKYFHKLTNNSNKCIDQNSSQKNALKGLEAIPTVEPIFPTKFIGNLLLLIPFSKSLENVGKSLERYGDICKFIGLNQTIVVLNSAPLVESLLKSKEYGHLEKLPFANDLLKPHLRNGVAVSNGKIWQRGRKIGIKIQSTTSLKGCMEMINEHSESFVHELKELFRDGQTHEISDQISRLFLKTITELVCGKANKIPDKEFNEYHRNVQSWKECVARRASNPLLHFNLIWNLHPLSSKHSAVVNYLREFANKQITQQRETRPSLQRCFLDDLIEAGIEDEQIVDEVNTMLFAGHETNASTIHFLCFMIALHPEIQRECQHEIDLIFEQNNRDGLSFSTVQSDLKYLERVILETLRIFPIGFEIFRKLGSPLDIKVKGEQIKLPVGTNIAITPFWIHRKAEYFPDPETFNPDRFLPEEKEKRHSCSYIPFSAGPRNCLGMKFAMLEIKTVAAYILRHFDLTTTNKMGEIPLLPLLTLTPAKNYTFSLKTRLA